MYNTYENYTYYNNNTGYYNGNYGYYNGNYGYYNSNYGYQMNNNGYQMNNYGYQMNNNGYTQNYNGYPYQNTGYGYGYPNNYGDNTMYNNFSMKTIASLLSTMVLAGSAFTSCAGMPVENEQVTPTTQSSTMVEYRDNNDTSDYSEQDVYSPYNYSGQAYVEINNNVPYFTEEEKTTDEFENYSELDSLGRCGVAYANISPFTMPTEPRGEIGMVKPSGWHTVKYDCVSGKYLYNRCHLIGYQLAAENANNRNLITGTRYLNIDGMLEHEDKIAAYVKDTGNHVLYRVTPKYTGDNLVANGVLMEGYSVEDNGAGIKFNIYAYNVQPGVEINYTTGDSKLAGDSNGYTAEVEEPTYQANPDGIIYYINTDNNKYHSADCRYVTDRMETFNGTIDWLNDNGYVACKVCKPDQK